MRDRYLSLLEASLTGALYEDPSIAPWTDDTYRPELRAIGGDWPSTALTMIGSARMRNLRWVCEHAIREHIPGDFLEAGIWRGGASIFMCGILEAWGDQDRRVFAADSFQGLPPPDARYPADAGDQHYAQKMLAVSCETVHENFKRYGLLDDRVVFLEGWFNDTLPGPIEHLSVLRVDCDMYASTIQVLERCYDKVSSGGAVIIDDYNSVPACKLAVDDFRSARKNVGSLVSIDPYAVWWQV